MNECSEARKLRLELLLRDYEGAREEERQSSSAMVNLLGAALVSALTALVILSSDPLGLDSGTKFWAAVLSPIVLLLPTGYSAQIGAKTAVRSYYLRVLERTIRSEMNENCGENSADLRYSDNLSFPAFSTTTFETVHTSPKSGLGTARLFAHFVTIVFACANCTLIWFGYTALLSAFDVQILQRSEAQFPPWSMELLPYVPQAYVIVNGGIMLTIFTLAWQTGQHGRRFFEDTVDEVNRRLALGLGATQRPYDDFKKSVDDASRYHVAPSALLNMFPKVDDLNKLLAEIVGCLIAFSYFCVFEHRWAGVKWSITLLVFVVFFEAYVYQTRYVVNDILGCREEGLLSSRSIRGRLHSEQDDTDTLRNGLFDLAKNLYRRIAYIVFAIPVWCFFGLGSVYSLSLVILVAITIPYELTRHYLGRSSFGSWGQKLAVRAMFILVSLGWPLRLGVGFVAYCSAIGAHFDLGLTWKLYVIPTLGENVAPLVQILFWLIVWGISFGVVTVSLIWALEALYEFDRSSHLSISANWKAAGKRHVLESLRMLLWPFGIHVEEQRSLGSIEMRHGLSPHEVFNEVSLKEQCYDCRTLILTVLTIFKLMILPWSVAVGGVSFASLEVMSLVYQVNLSFWTILAISASSVALAALIQYLLIATKLMAPIIIFGNVLVMVVLLGSGFGFHCFPNCAPPGFWVGYIGLYFWGGVMSFSYLRNRYENTRNVMMRIRADVKTMKDKPALWLTNRILSKVSVNDDDNQ